ncbi:MAG: iron complex outermembrane receptor protein [Arenicella sp.]|jgi:iron complex outermembrane receptor protein
MNTDTPQNNQAVLKRHRKKLIALAIGAMSAAPAHAALEEIVVTATKRAESMQNVPVAVQAMNGDTMKKLGVANFDEYINFLPNVDKQGVAPGRSEIYIRGVATEQSPTSVSSVQGSAPQVAVYLDEQPVAFGGRNLDVYAADIERVEVLAGPQGTLFGASSQSGTVRMITKKPVQGEYQFGASAGFSTTKGGDISTKGEAYINLPLSESMAFRAVVYNDNQGGWIDNVPGSFNPDDSQLIHVVNRNGISASSTIGANANVIRPSNGAFVEDNWNEASYAGARLGFAWDINEDWNVLVQHTQQSLKTEGAFDYDPTQGGESSSTKFAPVQNDDSFGLTSWTVEGRIGALDVVYTGGSLSREVENVLDYSRYTFGGGYQAYYLGSPFSYVAGGADTLHDFTKRYVDDTESDRLSNELRISSDPDNRVSFTAGVFIDSIETNSTGAFQYDGAIGAGFDVAVTPGTTNRVGVGNPGGRNASTIFVNDFTRNEDQVAFFGEVKFNITDDIGLRFGARNYDLDFQFQGATGSSFFCKNVNPSTLPTSRPGNGPVQSVRPDGTVGCDGNSFDNEVSAGLANIANTNTLDGSGIANPTTGLLIEPDLSADGTANQSDTIMRVSLDYRLNDDVMLFATWSEGFRPQVINRNAGRPSANQTGVFDGFFVPVIADTDELTNIEIGVKGEFLDNRLRMNATYYNSEIDNLQTTRFDPANVAFLVFIENVGDAEVQGIDLDYAWAATDNLTISGAASFVDSEITRLNPQLEGIAAPVGTALPYTADFSFNVRARYDFSLEKLGAEAYVQGALTYKGDSFAGITGNAYVMEDTTQRVYGRGSGLTIVDHGGGYGGAGQATAGSSGLLADGSLFKNGRYVQESYSLVNVSAGMNKDQMGFELYVNNLFDEHADVYIDTQNFVPTIATNRPRTVGFRMSYDF